MFPTHELRSHLFLPQEGHMGQYMAKTPEEYS